MAKSLERLWIFPILVVCLVYAVMAPGIGVDFSLLYPAGRAVLENHNPYIVAPHFYNPPWMLIFLVPVSLFKIQTGRWIWMALGIIGYLFSFKKLEFKNSEIIALFLSPFIYFDLGIGNYEWLVLLGTAIPANFGSWLVLLKPHISIGWFLLQFKRKKFLVVLPILFLTLLILLGLYAIPSRGEMSWSQDVFPYGIPIGLILLYLSIRKDDVMIALAAGLFLSPYVAMQSWIFALIPLVRISNWWQKVLIILISWIVVIIKV